MAHHCATALARKGAAFLVQRSPLTRSHFWLRGRSGETTLEQAFLEVPFVQIMCGPCRHG